MALTPEQFNKLVTKDEFTEFKDEMMEMKADVKKLLTAVDGLAKKTENADLSSVSNQAAHDRFKKRISRMEKTQNLEPIFDN